MPVNLFRPIQILDRIVVRLATIVATLSLFAILLINVIEIVARTAFDVSFAWIFETNLLLAAWTYFIGIVPVYARNGDIAIVGLSQLVPPHFRPAFDALLNVVSAATFALVTWYAYTLITVQWPFRTPGIGIPNAAFTAPLFLGCAALVLGLVRRLLIPDAETPKPRVEDL